jgi:outer membrane protein
MFKVLSGEESSTPSISSSTTNSTSPSIARSGEGIRIAYINNDSLIAGYQYQQELRASLEKQAKTFEADLQRKSKVFEENYAILEQQAPNLSQQELQMAQADLMQKQQELIQYRDEMAQKLAEEEARLTQDLKGDLDAVVNLLREEEDLDFIFTLDPSSVLLYASSSYDITSMVIERLNASHAARQQTK